MDKIKALLEKAGVKSELADQICESLANYKTSLRQQFNQEYAAKVEQAKKVCVEETEAHKRELARRVQIWCETKGTAIEAQLARQSALNESDAMSRLTRIVGLLEGIEPNGGQSGEVTATIEKLKQQVKVASEGKVQAIELANRKTAIAEKALKRNRQLATALKTLEERKQQARPANTVSEGRVPAKAARIDQSRDSGRSRSTRATLTENQDRRPVQQQRPSTNGFSIDNIAADMDSDLV